jgi:ribosomal protein L11 methyltransferase
LTIYYVQGRVDPAVDLQQDAFLGNWEEDGFSFLFFSRPVRASIDRLLERQPHLSLLDEIQMSYDQWQGGQPPPLSIGPFTIVPPWNLDQCPPTSQPILVDPGLVFGNGTHPTTVCCLKAIERVYRRHGAPRVLDLGTGTGMLALVAARLGGRKILAADLNGLAAVTAGRNVRLNHLQDRILVVQADARDCLARPSDLLIANIHFDVMADVIGTAAFKKHQHFILSGLLRSQVRTADLMLRKQSCNIIKQWDDKGIWYTLYGRQSESGVGG